MVKNAECPILLVPPSHDHLHFQKIVFACDHFGVYDDALAAIKYYSGSPDSQIDIIHVFQKGSEYMDKGVEVLNEDKEKHIKEVILFDPSFLDSIQAYVRNNDCDLIVMERKDRGFWKELFHVSRTRKMAVYSGVPLLVLHDDEIKSFASPASEKEAAQ
ncbi:MAG: universal stress protein, partial [Saprospiraceae bacterium]|nr:universal stress protein [Saprospiraceae bacterium]